MATTIVDPDQGAGYDYISLNVWESNQQGPISAPEIAKCRTTSGAEDSTAFTIAGWSGQSATNYIKIWTDPAESYRHVGEWNTSKFRHSVGDAVGATITEEFVIFEGIQFEYAAAASGRKSLYAVAFAGAGDFTLEKCILRNNSNTSYWGFSIHINNVNITSYISNNIFYDGHASLTDQRIIRNQTSTNTYISNNTFIDSYAIVRLEAGTVFLKNNIFDGQLGLISQSGGTISTDSTHNTEDLALDAGAFGATHATGTATSYTANKLNDSGGGLSGAQINSIVKNTTDTTYAYVTVVDSDTQLTLSADIFDNGNEGYEVYTNMFGTPTYSGSTYLLDFSDTVAMDKGTDLSGDPNYPFSDDILETTRS